MSPTSFHLVHNSQFTIHRYKISCVALFTGSCSALLNTHIDDTAGYELQVFVPRLIEPLVMSRTLCHSEVFRAKCD